MERGRTAGWPSGTVTFLSTDIKGMRAGLEPFPTMRSTRWPPLHAHVLDVGVAGLGDPQPVQAQQHGQGGVGVVEALGGEEEPGQLAAVEAPPLATGGTVGRRTYWAGFEAMRPSMWAKR